MPSWLLVALQFALMFALIFTTRPSAPLLVPAIALLTLGTALGLWAVSVNRWGNFNIRPELKRGARLITTGPYRWIRHPMYAAILLGMAAFLALDGRALRIFLYAALLAVLIYKARREEQNLRAAFASYEAYAARTTRLVPKVW